MLNRYFTDGQRILLGPSLLNTTLVVSELLRPVGVHVCGLGAEPELRRTGCAQHPARANDGAGGHSHRGAPGGHAAGRGGPRHHHLQLQQLPGGAAGQRPSGHCRLSIVDFQASYVFGYSTARGERLKVIILQFAVSLGFSPFGL